MRRHILLLSALGLLLASCGTPASPEPTPPLPADSFSSSSAESVAETHNVTFLGLVRPADISIYMEGTHRLELPDGRFILLSSETVDLNGYVGEQAEVTGSIRPTVEEGGTIMRVESVRLIESSSATSVETDRGSESALSSSLASSESPPPASVSSTPPPPPAISSRPSSATSLASNGGSAAASSVPPPPSTTDTTAQVKSMAKQNLAESNWTQAYCAPPTVGFCIPIHRNWYFKSFGANTSALWHVEVGSEAIESIGQGPLRVDLLGGSLESKGIADGEVRSESAEVAGYRTWTKDRHIRISAPASLQSIVEYMTKHLMAEE